MEEIYDQSDAGEGVLQFGHIRFPCSYEVTFRQNGRRREYGHISGTILMTNKEWEVLKRCGFIPMQKTGSDVWLRLADGEIAKGFLLVKSFGPAAPGRSIMRFEIHKDRPAKPRPF